MISIRSVEDVDHQIRAMNEIASESLAKVSFDKSNALQTLFRIKFEQVGMHPTSGHALNFIEQVNQTWTYYCSFRACKLLLALHPEVKEWVLAPGAHASQALDIMSGENEAVGAETFAAVDPKNNGKLEKDIAKLQKRHEQHRYVFFLSPKYPEEQIVEVCNGITIWSLGFEISK